MPFAAKITLPNSDVRRISCACAGVPLAAWATPKPTAKPSASPSVSSLSGSANIFAAASLTGAFNKIKADFIALNPKVNLTMNYNGSGSLVTQIQNGAPADVFASADGDNMNKLSGTGKIDFPQNFADNLLEIVVQQNNPKHIATLADLARPDVSVVLGDPASVPAGKYAKQALAAAGVSVTPKSLELNVTAVTQKIALQEADAGIVYVTDVKASVAAGQFVDGVPIPAAQHIPRRRIPLIILLAVLAKRDEAAVIIPE